MTNKIITSNSFLVITDYNFLPFDLKQSWISEYTENYLIYDRVRRFDESDKIIHQKNVGANIYDIFDYIYTNYENLPETIIFCKGNVIPRHCGIEKFNNIINNTTFTSIENYIRTTPSYSPGVYAYVDENDGYNEIWSEVDGTVANIHHGKYVFTYKDLINSIFKNATFNHYIRFAPGANYIIPKKDILKYNKNFYKTMREYISWHVQPGEAYLLERALYTLFNNEFDIREDFVNIKNND